jgi:glycosyltransferase involved in cell wall biosynthesis
MLLSSNSALHDPGDGRVAQAKYQAAALERLGHEVIRMDPWNTVPRESVDVLHVFEGGFGNYVLMPSRPRGYRCIALAPFIDSNQPMWGYRLAAGVHVGKRLYSPQYVLRRQGLNADVMIARSTHERERFVRGMGIPSAKVSIVLNGMTPSPPADGAVARKKFGLPERFVLNVGFFTQGRKNVLRLAEAARAVGCPLVLAGTPEPGPVLDRLKAMEGAGHVRMLGFVDRETLEQLYAACDVFALPSTHEGTGLVALEAASQGAKILITKNGGPPDYFGKWAAYVDPFRQDDITQALKSLWEQSKTAELQRHVRENLTWEQSARQLVAAYAAHSPTR